MALLLNKMDAQDMARVCAKALLAALENSQGMKVDYGGHRYIVHRDGARLIVAQADSLPDSSDTVIWDPQDPDAYLGL